LINFVDATNDANHYTKPPPCHVAFLLPVRRWTIYRLIYDRTLITDSLNDNWKHLRLR